jgi:hypothetical protein
MKKTASLCLVALASSAILVAGCFRGDVGAHDGEDPSDSVSAALEDDQLEISVKHALDTMCSQPETSNFLDVVQSEDAGKVRWMLIANGANAEYLAGVALDFKNPKADPGPGIKGRISLHVDISGDAESSQIKALSVRGSGAWINVWAQAADGTNECQPQIDHCETAKCPEGSVCVNNATGYTCEYGPSFYLVCSAPTTCVVCEGTYSASTNTCSTMPVCHSCGNGVKGLTGAGNMTGAS